MVVKTSLELFLQNKKFLLEQHGADEHEDIVNQFEEGANEEGPAKGLGEGIHQLGLVLVPGSDGHYRFVTLAFLLQGDALVIYRLVPYLS